MNWRAIGAIVRKDLTVVRESRAIILPLIIVPLIVLVILPLLATLAPSFVNLPGMGELGELGELLEMMPAALVSSLAGLSQQEQIVIVMVVYLFAPMFLIVPIMVANVIAADSFAGEKERKTIEALLYTPTTDRELVTAKLLAPWLASLAVTLVGFLAYSVVVNAAAWPIMGRIFFPNVMWLVLVIWVAPAVAAFGLAGSVLVSARVQTVQEAYQLGGVVVLPIVLLLVSQVTGLLFLSTPIVFLLGTVVWLISLALLWQGVRTFRRSRLVTGL